MQTINRNTFTLRPIPGMKFGVNTSSVFEIADFFEYCGKAGVLFKARVPNKESKDFIECFWEGNPEELKGLLEKNKENDSCYLTGEFLFEFKPYSKMTSLSEVKIIFKVTYSNIKK